MALSTRSSQDHLWLTHSPWLSLVGALVSLSSLHMLPYTYPLRLERHQVRPRLYRTFITTKNTGLSISVEFKSEEGKQKRKKKKNKPYGGRETTQPPLAPRRGCRRCPNSRHACNRLPDSVATETTQAVESTGPQWQCIRCDNQFAWGYCSLVNFWTLFRVFLSFPIMNFHNSSLMILLLIFFCNKFPSAISCNNENASITFPTTLASETLHFVGY